MQKLPQFQRVQRGQERGANKSRKTRTRWLVRFFSNAGNHKGGSYFAPPWASLPRLLLAYGTGLGSFYRSVFEKSDRSKNKHATAATASLAPWPCPPPFPEVFGRPAPKNKRSKKWFRRRVYLNLLVVTFSWLALNKPDFAPYRVHAGGTLTGIQEVHLNNLKWGK